MSKKRNIFDILRIQDKLKEYDLILKNINEVEDEFKNLKELSEDYYYVYRRYNNNVYEDISIKKLFKEIARVKRQMSLNMIFLEQWLIDLRSRSDNYIINDMGIF